jgi:hypothetical protein
MITRIQGEFHRYAGVEIGFFRAYDTPPLSASAAYFVEARQIESVLALQPIVSITDHDTITGPLKLRMFHDPARVPISLEWTLPFGPGCFHVGVHNLPSDLALQTVSRLTEIPCARCRKSGISCNGMNEPRCMMPAGELLTELASMPGVLIVLNHPLWDTTGLGCLYPQLLHGFLTRHACHIHAMELNGLRSWAENTRVLQLAEHWNLPVISGGDRHGREPNAILNLTSMETFSDFAKELREERRSVVLFLRQYQQPLRLRRLRTAWDVVREHASPVKGGNFEPGVFALTSLR